MKSIIKQIQQEPVLFQALIQSSLTLLAGFGVIHMNENQMGLVYAFTASLLAFITRQAVTPLVRPRDEAGNPLVPRT
jgi:uncharacterized membrane protein YjjP (DUF1212 family)